MTFYEAALRVLESEGRPLHFVEITEKSIAQNLLSHVGKMPEQTMLSRLAAMARRTRDRRVMVTAKDTFALTDWSLPEDAAALAETGLPEENEEDSLPPLRPVERHPEPRSDLVRSAGRSERKRRDEEEPRAGKRRRYPPVPEVAFELLSDASEGLKPNDLLERARSRSLASDELGAEQLLTSLLEDNQRRIDAGRRPQFLYAKDSGLLSLERAGSPSEAPPLELQAAFAEALGIPLEGGRPVLPSRFSGSASPSSGSSEGRYTDETSSLASAARTAVREARRSTAREVRQHLAQEGIATVEKSCVRMLHGLSFRELKVAKRGKDGPLLTARRKEGSLELRYAIRIWRASAPLDRRTVQDLRRDLGHYSAHVGLLLSPQELRGDARSEAQGAGPLVLLWCSDALGEKFLEARVGVRSIPLELFELDGAFFEEAKRDGEEAQRRREERHRDRDKLEPPAGQPETEESPRAAGSADTGSPDEQEAGEDAEGGDEDLEAARAFVGTGPVPAAEGSAAASEHRRRRRRRRGRRGRGGRPEDAGSPGAPSPAAAGGEAQTPREASPPPPPPPPGPSSDGGAAG